MADLHILRAEYRDLVIGPHLEELLYKVVSRTAPKYPPAEYSRSGVWDQASLNDAAQDWITDRLLARGDLGPMLGSAKTEAALASLLTRSLRQHLINARTLSSATNLFDRMAKTLKQAETFRCLSDPGKVGEMEWTLANGGTTEAAEGDVVHRLITYAGTRRDADLGVVRYGPYSLKSSPILRASQLHDLLAELLGEAQGSVSTSDLFQVLRHRFNLATLPPKVLSDLEGSAGDDVVFRSYSEPPKADDVVVAHLVRAQLTDQQILDVRALTDADSVAAASIDSERTESELMKSAEALVERIAAEVDNLDDARAVHQLIVESLYPIKD